MKPNEKEKETLIQLDSQTRNVIRSLISSHMRYIHKQLENISLSKTETNYLRGQIFICHKIHYLFNETDPDIIMKNKRDRRIGMLEDETNE